ncbi:MAG: NADP-dependent isocitrate dehydrogenase [Waddliaceae bacterium]
MSKEKVPIAVAEGDGIGPEIMAATLHILEESDAAIEIKKVDIGEKVYLEGNPTGITPETWEVIRERKAFLKAPVITPQGGGFKSLNVTIRATLGLFANVRPAVSYHPVIATKHPDMDVVIVRENEEDLYAGIEYRQTPETTHALKIITRPGCERIIRYAFEYALSNNRKKVTCFTKDNILKLSDGLFHKIFDEIGKDYPMIEQEHWIIDIGTAKLADTPEAFDVVVLPNLYGDIVSDVTAQIAGSVGLAGSANIGLHGAMFEAIHGSAPRRAGQNAANPSGLLLAGVQMLVHIGQPAAAEGIHNAWLRTIEEGIHTYDVFQEGVSKQKVGTREFARAVVERLGQKPEILKEVRYSSPKHSFDFTEKQRGRKQQKETIGIDIFIESNDPIQDLQAKLSQLANQELQLTMIANRGVMVWPHQIPETACGDTWRCRFMAKEKGAPITKQHIASLIQRLATAQVDFVQTEHLCTFDGVHGYTLAPDEQ